MKTILDKNFHDKIPDNLPVIPTMDVVVFPHMIVPLLVLDKRIIKGVNDALDGSKMVLLLAARQNVSQQEAIGTKDLYQVGTVATIMRMIKIPEGGIKILVQGVCKANALSLITDQESLRATVESVPGFDETEHETEVLAQIKNLKALAEEMASTGQSFSPDFHVILSKMQDPDKVVDFILSHLNLTVEQAQELLECTSQKTLLNKLYGYLYNEIEVAQMQEKIKNDARDSMNKSQREYYLREQMRAIKKELGEVDDEELEKFKEKLDTLAAADDIKEEVKRQINRLENTSPESMEAMVIRNYLEWIFALPWGIETTDNLDVAHAQKILDEDHYGLKEIKERILDFISVRKLKQDSHAPIICFVGPPGTGKTSLGKSIARSMGRNYFRISLGGVKDEAEIRGHRRTYVGAMPGRFIQGIRKAGSMNPIIIIDELDKIGSDFRGDPSAAMLEVLDPQQNKQFYDNYLGVPFDLSKTIFIATANSLETISTPLRDRMEIIQLSGYTPNEKLHIAQRYLVNRAIEATGLDKEMFQLNDDILTSLITHYTRESGVRQLERLIQKLASKSARSLVETGKPSTCTIENLETYLGPQTFLDEDIDREDQIGITNGLAWTPYGGEMLKIEAITVPGKGTLLLTGHLGDVMKESAQAALSYIRAHAEQFGIKQDAFTSRDLHLHVPAGAVPKDGPSAGITILTSMLSAFTQCPIRSHYAMTGELNLRGQVMPIGGVKEKVLAAKQNKMTHVILPERNKHDLQNADEITNGINIIWVKKAEEVFKHVLPQLI
jgi:ATP-dependent Lon protease